MPNPRPVREVVFVDGVRTPFGKANGGLYKDTRADDMVVRCIRELLRRNPSLPPERVDEVAIAATTQIGDQGLTIGRTAALLAGLPNTTPGYAIDRGEPARPLPEHHQAARGRVRRGFPGARRQGVRERPDPAGPRADRDPVSGAGLGLRRHRRADAPRYDGRGPGGPEDAVPPARPGDGRQLGRYQRRRDRVRARLRRGGARARADSEDEAGLVRLRRRRARGDG